MSWLKSQWRGRESVHTTLFTITTILGLPCAAAMVFMAYASVFDATLMPTAEFSHQNLAMALRELPDLLAVIMMMAGATLVAMPLAVPCIAAIIGVHQLIAMTRSGGGPGGTLRRMGSALRRAVSHIVPPRSSQRTVTAHA